MLINKALLKYGYSGFMLDILEFCDKDEVIVREQYYLDLFKPEYNVLKKAVTLLVLLILGRLKLKLEKLV